MITFSMVTGAIMVTMDSTIANVALPNMQATFSATQDQISWVLTSYIVATAIMTPMAGYLSERIGARNMLAISFSGFACASILCGFATSVESMVLYRVLQGALGAAVFPLSQSIMLDINPQEKHGSAMAMWGVGMMVGPIMGPILGGVVTDLWGWPWIFFINVPIGLAAAIGIYRYLPAQETKTTPFDMQGFLFMALAIGGLQLMLDRGQSMDWFASNEIIMEAGVGFICFYLFIAHIMTKKQPFIDPKVFGDRNLRVGLMVSFIIGITFTSSLALLPLFLMTMAEFPARTVGLILAPRGFGMMVGMFTVGQLIGKMDERILIASGLVMSASMLFLMADFTPDVDIWTLVWTGVVQNFGLGLVFVPLSTMAYSTLNPIYRTTASSMYNLLRNIGSSIGIAMAFTFLARGIQQNHAVMAESITLYNDVHFGSGMPDQFNLTDVSGLYMFDMFINREAAVEAYQYDFFIMALFTLVCLPLIIIMQPTSRAIAQARAAA
jgi:DHA2 family multidrug resistance protein